MVNGESGASESSSERPTENQTNQTKQTNKAAEAACFSAFRSKQAEKVPSWVPAGILQWEASRGRLIWNGAYKLRAPASTLVPAGALVRYGARTEASRVPNSPPN